MTVTCPSPAVIQQIVNGPYWSTLTRLGSGASKVAFDLGNGHVLKVGYGSQMEEEVNYWNNAKPEWRQFLAPICAYNLKDGPKWIVQKKAVRVGQVKRSDLAAINAGTEGSLEDDLIASNAGYIDGKPVAIDFGLSTLQGSESHGTYRNSGAVPSGSAAGQPSWRPSR